MADIKPRIVGKKELEDSGLSLRDFLNKERGLVRRKDKDPTAGEAKDKSAQEAADRVDPGSNDGGESRVKAQNAKIMKDTGMNPAEYVRSGKSAIDRQNAADKTTADTYIAAAKSRRPATETDTNKNAADMYTEAALAKSRGDGMARGGKVKSASSRGDGCAQRGKTRA